MEALCYSVTITRVRCITQQANGLSEEDEEEDDGKAQEDADLLEQIKESKESNNGRIEDQFINRMFRDKLKSMPCQNQGFVIDGFPKTYEQAKELFSRKFSCFSLCHFLSEAHEWWFEPRQQEDLEDTF